MLRILIISRGFVPQAQFIFAKNCSQVWAEALNDFTQWHGKQGRQELPKEVKGDDVEKDQEPKAEPELEVEEPERGQEAGQVRPRPRGSAVGLEWGALPVRRLGVAMSSIASGIGMWARLPATPPCPGSLCQSTGAELDSPIFLRSTSLPRFPPIPWMTEILASSSCQASLVMCPVPASSSAPAFLCSPTRPCRNLDKCTHRADPRRASNISPHFLGPTLRNWAFYLTMGAMCQGISSSLAALMGISPMMLWASATSRSSSWHRYLDFKFSLPFSSIPAILLEGREMGWRVGGDTKRKWFGGQAPFLLIGVINK
ncbi:ciliary microtubule inner protein 2B isoform 5-T5 [Hipposideros larvatus]